MSVDGIWYVKLEDGDVERVTLDQLDEWFQSGRIDEKTMVLADGADQWMKLVELLGLSDEAPCADEAETAPATPVAVAAAAGMPPPVQAEDAPPAPAVATPWSPPVHQPQRITAPLAPAISPVMMRPPVAPQATPMVASVRPVAIDLGDATDLGDLAFRKSSRKGWVIGGVVAALAAGVGGFIVVTQSSASSQPERAPVFAAAAASPPPRTAPDPVAPSPEPQQAGMSSIMDPTQSHLTDDQRKKLLEADKKSKTHATTSGPSTWHAPKEKPTGFTSGGNKYDPLNSSL